MSKAVRRRGQPPLRDGRRGADVGERGHQHGGHHRGGAEAATPRHRHRLPTARGLHGPPLAPPAVWTVTRGQRRLSLALVHTLWPVVRGGWAILTD